MGLALASTKVLDDAACSRLSTCREVSWQHVTDHAGFHWRTDTVSETATTEESIMGSIALDVDVRGRVRHESPMGGRQRYGRWRDAASRMGIPEGGAGRHGFPEASWIGA